MQNLPLIEKKTIMFTVMAVLFFSAVNQTIVGTTLPRIVSEIGGMEYFNWVFTVFMLTSSMSSVLVGKLSDNYGRKPFFIFGIITLMLASLVCGISQTMPQLIVSRGFQGVGAGIIISLSFASVGDLFHQKERGKWQGQLTSVFGLSSVVGPTMGGYIVDHFDWHWIFWVFLPFGIIALFVMIRYYPKKNELSKKISVDYLGILTLTITFTSILYYLSIVGLESSFFNREGILFFGIIMLILFVVIELKTDNPIIPLKLFKKNTFWVSNLVSFFLGMGMFGVIIYTPLFMQGVMQATATQSGIVMMAMTISLVVASSLSGNLISKTGRYKLLGALGILLMITGLFWMANLNMNSSVLETSLRLILFGVGLGISFTVFSLAVQFEIGNQNLGVAVSSIQLFRQFGGTVGVTLFGGIFTALMYERNQKVFISMSSTTSEVTQSLLKDPKILLNQKLLHTITDGLSGNVLDNANNFILALRVSMGSVLSDVFLISAGILALAFTLAILIKEVVLEDNS